MLILDQRDETPARAHAGFARSEVERRDRGLHDRKRRAVDVRDDLDVTRYRIPELAQRGQHADAEPFRDTDDGVHLMSRGEHVSHNTLQFRREWNACEAMDLEV